VRIAFFTPLSPLRSALADYGEGMALALASLPDVKVDLFIDHNYKPDNPVMVEQFQIYSYSKFASRAGQYDLCLYSVGDQSRYHGYIFPFIHRYPGIVILNDLTLHRSIMQSTLGQGNARAYLDELAYAYGLKDLCLANQIIAGEGDHLVLEYPLFERVVDSSLGVIVQNQYARRQILARRPQAQVACIPYPFFMPPGFPDFDLAGARAQQRADMGLDDDFVIGSFGIFVPNKHLEDCLNAFAHLVHQHPRSKYILGGFAAADYDLAGYIRALGLERQIILTGWAPPPQFAKSMFALDMGIHLRYPHIGGTPYTPIRLMGLGVCTIVSDIEPLAELPQGACVKVAPDEYQQDTLVTLLAYLVNLPDFRQQISDNGRQFIARHHNVGDIARRYVTFMEAVSPT
jgi:glycosyltransferase involved in cell wall biosynthesis